MPELNERNNGFLRSVSGCTLGDARVCGNYNSCQRCGFYEDEIERRRQLPLILDERTNLHRKFVGRFSRKVVDDA